jgi:gas vesicle protein
MPEETFRWVITGAVLIATLCMVVMAVATIVMYRVMSKMQAKTAGMIDSVEPIVETVKRLAIDNAPKISGIATRAKEIADNTKEISDVARDQAHRFAEVGRDIADKTKAQVARVDAVVDETVDQVQHAGSNVREVVMKPVREASGVLAGVKAAVSAYAQGKRSGVSHVTQDEEMFI